MIKKLRWKLVLINMVLVSVMLTVILGMVCYFTATTQEAAAQTALKDAAQSHMRPGNQPCFVLEVRPNGDMVVQGSSYFDLSDEALLREIYSQVMNQGRERGVLRNYDLRYYRAGARVAFLDAAFQQRNMRQLVQGCVLGGILALGGFFVISIFLSRWAVRPVETAWQQQRQFVADASHELKTPLTVILTNGELLQEDGYSPEEKARFADSILAKARQMRSLTENLLELARADNSQVSSVQEQVDYSRLVQDTAMEFEPVYFERGLTLESQVEPGIQAVGSAAHLQQVVQILLDNGQKYASPGGTAFLTLVRQGKRSLLAVTTPGTPLTAQQCRDVFRRFYRVDAARTSDGSYGLGLSIAQRIITDHGGKIWAQSGTDWNCFYVSLPE